MKPRLMWTLVILNVALLAALLGRLGAENAAHAQQARRAGEYLMIPGAVNGLTSDLVYIFDSANGRLSAVTYDDGAKRLGRMPALPIAEIFQRGVEAAETPPAQPARRRGY